MTSSKDSVLLGRHAVRLVLDRLQNPGRPVVLDPHSGTLHRASYRARTARRSAAHVNAAPSAVVSAVLGRSLHHDTQRRPHRAPEKLFLKEMRLLEAEQSLHPKTIRRFAAGSSSLKHPSPCICNHTGAKHEDTQSPSQEYWPIVGCGFTGRCVHLCLPPPPLSLPQARPLHPATPRYHSSTWWTKASPARRGAKAFVDAHMALHPTSPSPLRAARVAPKATTSSRHALPRAKWPTSSGTTRARSCRRSTLRRAL